MVLPDYPPQLPPKQLKQLRDLAVDFALGRGLVIRPSASNANSSDAYVTHAPVALFPSPFPRHCFERAVAVQPLFNRLIHRCATDENFLREVMESLSTVDDFMKQLYDIYCQVRKEGIAQPISFGFHRCDYLLHTQQETGDLAIRQVEFNTIASSFGSLSTLTGELHRYLHQTTGFFLDKNSQQAIDSTALPKNEALNSLAKGIALSHEIYGVKNAVAMIIVQPGERNAFDQRWAEYTLLERYNILLIRRTLTDIGERGELDKASKVLRIDGYEVAVAYFRAGYDPKEYISEIEWSARLTIERSKAIKCPTVAYQLVGSKKVQQVLAMPGRLEALGYNADECAQLRSTFAGLYPLDSTPEGIAAQEAAMRTPEKFVMKPQREGGGHNIYGKDIPAALSKLSPEGRRAHILMDLIVPPTGARNLLLREGGIALAGEIVSELGIYGVFIGTEGGGKGGEGGGEGEAIEKANFAGGHLLRTKPRNINEGGVAAGFAFIDSPYLI
ncbi:uncharacterized protein VTP21DRAFT_10341 [Calcarisporiella thermophila]|uniref:uncharacterized protein n=1 Tax=Calcarisporiella thermophila TaxID=911321 RepID=UPI0037421E9F